MVNYFDTDLPNNSQGAVLMDKSDILPLSDNGNDRRNNTRYTGLAKRKQALEEERQLKIKHSQ